MSKQTYIENNKIVTCDNCGRKIKHKQLVFHGKGRCSEEPTKFELRVAKLRSRIKKLQQESVERRALPPELQKQWDDTGE